METSSQTIPAFVSQVMHPDDLRSSLGALYADANYLLKSLQGYKNKGISVYAISIQVGQATFCLAHAGLIVRVQNEPENSNPTYPTCKISASQEAQIGLALRSLMDSNGFSGTKIIGYDHNWDDAGSYPIQLVRHPSSSTTYASYGTLTQLYPQMQQASSAFAGVSFHCYGGSVSQQDIFHSAYPDKEIYFTECSGTQGSDWWSDIKVRFLSDRLTCSGM